MCICVFDGCQNWPEYDKALKARGSLMVWLDKEAEYRRQWRKVHLAIDADPFEIRAVEVTNNSIGDAPMLPRLLSQIPEDEIRNAASKACRDIGHKLWKQQSHYHRRSLVETKMHCFKRLGERLTTRTFDRQTTGVHIRVAILNRFTRMGRPQTVATA